MQLHIRNRGYEISAWMVITTFFVQSRGADSGLVNRIGAEIKLAEAHLSCLALVLAT